MVEAAVILGVVGNVDERGFQFERAVNAQILVPHLFRRLERVFETVRAVKQRRFVHVVPEALDARIHQLMVLRAEPLPHVLAQEIREARAPRPNRAHEQAAIRLLDEVILLHTLVVNRVASELLDARVNNRYKVDVLVLHARIGGFQIREMHRIPGEVLEILHVVNVHAHVVQRDVPLAVFGYDEVQIVFACVPPAALDVAHRPLRRNVAASDEVAKLAHQPCQRGAFNQIHRQIAVFGRNDRLAAVRIPQIKRDRTGIVEIRAENTLLAAEQQQIVAGINAALVLRVAEIVHVPRAIKMPALVDAADILAQPEDEVIVAKYGSERDAAVRFGDGEVGNFAARRRNFADDRHGGKGSAENIA